MVCLYILYYIINYGFGVLDSDTSLGRRRWPVPISRRRPTPLNMDADELIDRAREALAESYAPYSDYQVGAALLTADGTVYTGCNIENANYSNSLHAEEVAIGTAVADGHHAFEAIAVTSAARDGVTPCGMCRQTLAEFCDESFAVHCDTGDGVRTYTLGELLPDAISAETLTESKREDSL